MKKLLNWLLSPLGIEIKRIPTDPVNPIEVWDTDPAFSALYDLGKSQTEVDKKRCFMLYQLALQSAPLEGDAVEVGVYRGGTAKMLSVLLAQTTPSKTLHLFDAFEGMPATDPSLDLHKAGDFRDTSLKNVQAFLEGARKVQWYPGYFPHTASPMQGKLFSFVHVDVDIYASVKDCCDFFYNRMVKGGIVVFDDYGFLSCPGAKQAVDEFFADKPERAIYLPTGQALVIKQ